MRMTRCATLSKLDSFCQDWAPRPLERLCAHLRSSGRALLTICSGHRQGRSAAKSPSSHGGAAQHASGQPSKAVARLVQLVVAGLQQPPFLRRTSGLGEWLTWLSCLRCSELPMPPAPC